ncbi:hypothetical protein F2S72_01550 [Pseudomonas syringae pv. actinidiae]|nr:hypothetical protein [Pseudomonas syringae pv. actinidiae]
MGPSLLTEEDRYWLESHAEAVRTSMSFMVSNLLYPHTSQTMSRAHEVLIWFKGSYIRTTDLLRKIEKEVPYSQIFEQWQSRVYDEVQRVCRSLSDPDRMALIMVAGFDIITESEIRACASEAVREASEALYGSEDECDEPIACDIDCEPYAIDEEYNPFMEAL